MVHRALNRAAVVLVVHLGVWIIGGLFGEVVGGLQGGEGDRSVPRHSESHAPCVAGVLPRQPASTRSGCTTHRHHGLQLRSLWIIPTAAVH